MRAGLAVLLPGLKHLVALSIRGRVPGAEIDSLPTRRALAGMVVIDTEAHEANRLRGCHLRCRLAVQPACLGLVLTVPLKPTRVACASLA